MGATPTQQTMLALAFLADADFKQPFMNDCTTAVAVYGVIESNLAILNQKTNADWNVVWGPTLFSFPGTAGGRFIDNCIYVARNGNNNQYVIAIAGTDRYSWDDWAFEDFLVGSKVPWPFKFVPNPKDPFAPVPENTAGDISLGTFLGLSILLNLQVCCETSGGGNPLPGEGMQLLPFLASIVEDQPVEVCTTGHSLGGALSPTLALALVEMRSQWDPKGIATVSPFSFAGPTPGDVTFASYFNTRLPNLQRIWNNLDVVPHAWDVAHLKEIPTLYGTHPIDVILAVDLLVQKVGHLDYAPLNDAAPAFDGPLQKIPGLTPTEQFVREAVLQHINAYQNWAGIEGWFSLNSSPPPAP